MALPVAFAELLKECAGTILDETASVKRLVDEFSQFSRLPTALPCDVRSERGGDTGDERVRGAAGGDRVDDRSRARRCRRFWWIGAVKKGGGGSGG